MQIDDDGASVSGVFSLFGMVHTMPFTDADGEQQEAVPWDGSATAGDRFIYASKPCSGNAPVNNLATDLPALGGAVPGSRVPVSVRSHPFRFRATESGGVVRLAGVIALTVCQLRPGSTADSDPVPDSAKARIDVEWDADVDRRSVELVTWRGTFSVRGGTGRYAQLRGEGDIAGYFFCFDPDGCAARGALLDAQYTMIGRYRIPVAAAESAHG